MNTPATCSPAARAADPTSAARSGATPDRWWPLSISTNTSRPGTAVASSAAPSAESIPTRNVTRSASARNRRARPPTATTG